MPQAYKYAWLSGLKSDGFRVAGVARGTVLYLAVR